MQTVQKQVSSKTKISYNVIASIAEAAAREIPGVYALAPSPVDITCTAPNKPRGKFISGNSAHDVIIDVRVIINEDSSIPKISDKIQHTVKDAIQNMTGVAVNKVNIIITKICFDAPPV